MSDKKLMTTGEAAEEAGLNVTAIRARLRRKSLHSKKVGKRHLVIRDKAFEQLLEMQKKFPRRSSSITMQTLFEQLEANFQTEIKSLRDELKEIKLLLKAREN